jgi:hypothetical protein
MSSVISPKFPLIRDHYWLKHPSVIEEISFGGRTFLSKYEKINAYLNDELIQMHLDRKITLATSIPADAAYFVIDYNGSEKELFYHKAAKLLRSLDLNDFQAYESKTPSHLHLYVACGDISAPKREELGKIISNKLEERLQKQWRIFPNAGLPEAYNILNLPYTLFKG